MIFFDMSTTNNSLFEKTVKLVPRSIDASRRAGKNSSQVMLCIFFIIFYFICVSYFKQLHELTCFIRIFILFCNYVSYLHALTMFYLHIILALDNYFDAVWTHLLAERKYTCQIYHQRFVYFDTWFNIYRVNH